MLIATAILSFSLFSGRSFLAMRNYLELDSRSRIALDKLTREIRQTRAVTAYATNAITFLDYDKKSLQYTFNATNRTLIRTKDSKSTVLLGNCDSVTFNLLADAPASGTFALESVTDPVRCKGIFISWICSLTFLEPAVNAANMTTATIVLRLK